MGAGWNPTNGFQFFCFFLVLILGFQIHPSSSLNDEGFILLEFRARVSTDPFDVFSNWNLNDNDPCLWCGVHCVAGKVEALDLSELSFEGSLSPDLGKLSHLKSLLLSKNHFYGPIPKEIGGLTKLEVLDLRGNNFSGTVPAEIGRLPSLKCLLLCDNKFEGSSFLELGRLKFLSDRQFGENLACTLVPENDWTNREIEQGLWENYLEQLNEAYSLIIPIKDAVVRYLNVSKLQWFNYEEETMHGCVGSLCNKQAGSSGFDVAQNVEVLASPTRRRLFEVSSNLAAAPATGGAPSQQVIALPTTRSSGSFPAVPNAKINPPTTPVQVAPVASPLKGFQSDTDVASTNSQSAQSHTSHSWIYFLIVPMAFALLIISLGLVVICRRQGVTTIGPWKTGLSGQLQKAFVTGVPKLNRSELETACEDFSNIIATHEGCTVYKGTLSSGVEIAVASTLVVSLKEWSKNAEMSYRKKIDTLSRVNHKNFVNLIGFCEEDEPFNRMMVFEYAPNGSLFEHLHIKEMEHLDWSARMRIIMGTAYCLQYMHHDLNPPVAHSNLNSHQIYLTDDYAAKIAEICFLPQSARKTRISGDGESEHSELPPLADPEMNVYSFGILLLEIISGKLPYSKEQGPLENLAAEYLNSKRSISFMIDSTLKAFKNNELDVICEIIQECIQPDPRQRPTMKDITSKLREVIGITPDQATPRLSPLWWAELEILSVEAT